MENGRAESLASTENAGSERKVGDRLDPGPDVKAEPEKSGIVIGTDSEFRRSPLRRILEHWGEHHVKYTSAATFLGIIFAFRQLSVSVKQFELQMEEQRKSTSSQLVSDFFEQVGDMAALSSTGRGELQGNQVEIDCFIVSRAQMLIDSRQTTDHRNEIVRIRGSNGYGPLFGSKLGVESPGIHLNRASLRAIRVYGAYFTNANFFCIGFGGANIEKKRFVNSDINNSDFSGAEIGLANFDEVHSCSAGAAAFFHCLQSPIVNSKVRCTRRGRVLGATAEAARFACPRADVSVYSSVCKRPCNPRAVRGAMIEQSEGSHHERRADHPENVGTARRQTRLRIARRNDHWLVQGVAGTLRYRIYPDP